MDDSKQPEFDLDSWPAPEPSPDFADRLLTRIRDEFVTGTHPMQRVANAAATTRTAPPKVAEKRSRTVLIATGSALVAAAAAAAVMTLVMSTPQPSGGSIARASAGVHAPAAMRSTEQIGTRATAVAEAGASLAWKISDTGAATITQDGGAVFYRVERDVAQSFEVATGHGKVTVTGTCFTIDVSRQATNVTVHEGSVSVNSGGNIAQLTAGESVYFSGGRVYQRGAVSDSSSGNRTAGSAVKPTTTMSQPVAPIAAPRFNQSPEILKQWAQTCKVVADLPPFEGDENRPVDLNGWANYAQSLGGTQQEVIAIKEAYQEVEDNAYKLLGQGYETFTGNKFVAGMSMDESIFEITRTGGYMDAYEAYQDIAQERAGLKAPPSKDAKLGPVEYLLRKILEQGDIYEAAIAKRLGPARARQLREKNQGWPGTASEWEGCPPPKPTKEER
jgi:ferric-dicitrate binding protein FerR (iron transport regulator)